MSGIIVDPTQFGGASLFVEKYLVADFAGSIDDWNIWLSAQAPENIYRLHVEPGTYTLLGGGAEADYLALANRHVIITGHTAADTHIFTTGVAGPAPFSSGENAGSPSHNPQPRFATAHVGDTTITLLIPAKAALFPIDSWTCISAWCMQNSGYPPNLHYFEFRRVLAANSLTGVLTLDEGLHHDYRADLPNFPTFDPTFQPDRGGAATAWPWSNLDYRFAAHTQATARSAWDMDLELRNLTLEGDSPGVQFYGSCKSILTEDCIIANSTFSPNSAKTWTMRRCIHTDTRMEVDKEIEHLIFEDCQIAQLFCQSSSTELMEVTDCDLVNSFGVLGSQGVPKNSVFTRCDFGHGIASLSPFYFGFSETLVMTDCTSEVWPGAGGPASANVGTLEAGGIIRFTRDAWENFDFGDIAARYIPGATFMVQKVEPQYQTMYAFKVLDIECEGGNLLSGDVLISTTIDDALYTTIFAIPWRAYLYGPQLTISNCSGCKQLRSLSRGHPPGGRPYIYSNSGVYDGTDGLGTPANNDTPSADGSSVHGFLTSITIEVTQAYTGGVSLASPALRMFGTFANGADTVLPNATIATWAAHIDLTQTGTRTITPGSVTGSVGTDIIQAMPAAPVWFTCVDPSDLYIRTPGGNRADLNSVSAGQRPNVRVTILVDPMLD